MYVSRSSIIMTLFREAINTSIIIIRYMLWYYKQHIIVSKLDERPYQEYVVKIVALFSGTIEGISNFQHGIINVVGHGFPDKISMCLSFGISEIL